MPDRPATLRDVAAAARVHPATASRALNPETRILVSEDTARRVIEAAAKLGYRPNPVARSLRTRRSHTVGVLIPDLNNPLFPPIVRGLEDKLAAAGYVALLGNTDADASRERTLFEQMRARHVDGFVLATATLHDQLLAEAAAAEVPLVLMNRLAPDYSFPSVSVDNEQGARMAVSHLARLGHPGSRNRRTAGGVYRGGPPARVPGGHGHPRAEVDEDLIAYARRYTVEEGTRCYGELLAPRRDFTAVAAGNDMLAVGCYAALDEDRAVPRGHLGDRLQRHAVHRPAPAAADHGALPALPAGHRSSPAAARADQRGRGASKDPYLAPELVVRGSTIERLAPDAGTGQEGAGEAVSPPVPLRPARGASSG